MEEWRPVVGYEGLYEVSNMGRVKSLERTVWDNRGCYRTVHERILKPRKDRSGYLQVNLSKDGKVKWCTVHRLVAIAFLDNADNLPEVNHKDEDKTNNCVENLEWCSRSYNMEYSYGKSVLAIHKINGLILEFTSIHEAERQLGIANQSICACLKGKTKSAGGYVWYYSDADIEE